MELLDIAANTKQLMGEELYPTIHAIRPRLAAKITVILLQLERNLINIIMNVYCDQ